MGRQFKRPAGSPLAIGIACGAAAAIGYTIANGFLRALATQLDPAWVSSIKGGCTVAIFAPWLLVLAIRDWRYVCPPARTIGSLVFASIVVQFGGNWLNQIALGDVGVALVVPLTLGAMIISSAMMGRIFLQESVPPRVAIAMLVLLASVILLSMGADQAARAMHETGSTHETPVAPDGPPEGVGGAAAWIWIRGTLAACASGVSYAVLGVAIRAALATKIPLATPMVLVGIIGLLGLGSAAVLQHGITVITETTSVQWQMMLAAGCFNAFAFLALSQALRIMPVVYVNAINVTQVAMAAVLGMTIFNEPFTGWLVGGLMIMSIGFAILSKRKRDPVAASI